MARAVKARSEGKERLKVTQTEGDARSVSASIPVTRSTNPASNAATRWAIPSSR